MQLWQPCQKIFPKFLMTRRSKSENIHNKTINFSGKFTSLKCSSGPVECSFDNTAQMFWSHKKCKVFFSKTNAEIVALGT